MFEYYSFFYYNIQFTSHCREPTIRKFHKRGGGDTFHYHLQQLDVREMEVGSWATKL